jgi:malate dehydrogenase
MKAAKGEKGIVEPTFVYLPGVPGGDEIAKETGCNFFSVPVELGVSPPVNPIKSPPHLLTSTPQPSGAEKAINVLGNINAYEKKLLEKCIEGLKGNIEKGIEFVANPPSK